MSQTTPQRLGRDFSQRQRQNSRHGYGPMGGEIHSSCRKRLIFYDKSTCYHIIDCSFTFFGQNNIIGIELFTNTKMQIYKPLSRNTLLRADINRPTLTQKHTTGPTSYRKLRSFVRKEKHFFLSLQAE